MSFAGDAHFECVRRAAVGAGLLHGLVLAALDVVGLVASPMDDGVGPVLGDHEVDVVLFRSAQVLAAEDQPVVVRVAARLEEDERSSAVKFPAAVLLGSQ